MKQKKSVNTPRTPLEDADRIARAKKIIEASYPEDVLPSSTNSGGYTELDEADKEQLAQEQNTTPVETINEGNKSLEQLMGGGTTTESNKLQDLLNSYKTTQPTQTQQVQPTPTNPDFNVNSQYDNSLNPATATTEPYELYKEPVKTPITNQAERSLTDAKNLQRNLLQDALKNTAPIELAMPTTGQGSDVEKFNKRQERIAQQRQLQNEAKLFGLGASENDPINRIGNEVTVIADKNTGKNKELYSGNIGVKFDAQGKPQEMLENNASYGDATGNMTTKYQDGIPISKNLIVGNVGDLKSAEKESEKRKKYNDNLKQYQEYIKELAGDSETGSWGNKFHKAGMAVTGKGGDGGIAGGLKQNFELMTGITAPSIAKRTYDDLDDTEFATKVTEDLVKNGKVSAEEGERFLENRNSYPFMREAVASITNSLLLASEIALLSGGGVAGETAQGLTRGQKAVSYLKDLGGATLRGAQVTAVGSTNQAIMQTEDWLKQQIAQGKNPTPLELMAELGKRATIENVKGAFEHTSEALLPEVNVLKNGARATYKGIAGGLARKGSIGTGVEVFTEQLSDKLGDILDGTNNSLFFAYLRGNDQDKDRAINNLGIEAVTGQTLGLVHGAVEAGKGISNIKAEKKQNQQDLLKVKGMLGYIPEDVIKKVTGLSQEQLDALKPQPTVAELTQKQQTNQVDNRVAKIAEMHAQGIPSWKIAGELGIVQSSVDKAIQALSQPETPVLAPEPVAGNPLQQVQSKIAESKQTGEIPVVNGELVNKQTVNDLQSEIANSEQSNNSAMLPTHILKELNNLGYTNDQIDAMEVPQAFEIYNNSKETPNELQNKSKITPSAEITPNQLQNNSEITPESNAYSFDEIFKQEEAPKPLTPEAEKIVSGEAKNTLDLLTEVPRHELPNTINNAMAVEAGDMLKEIGGASRQSTAPTLAGGIKGEANRDWVSSTNYSSFPDWFGTIKGANRKSIIVALEKIIKDNGADKGVMVARVKEAIISNLTHGKEIAEKFTSDGKTKRNVLDVIPVDEDINRILSPVLDKKITLDELFNEHDNYIKTKEQEAGNLPANLQEQAFNEENRGDAWLPDEVQTEPAKKPTKITDEDVKYNNIKSEQIANAEQQAQSEENRLAKLTERNRYIKNILDSMPAGEEKNKVKAEFQNNQKEIVKLKTKVETRNTDMFTPPAPVQEDVFSQSEVKGEEQTKSIANEVFGLFENEKKWKVKFKDYKGRPIANVLHNHLDKKAIKEYNELRDKAEEYGTKEEAEKNLSELTAFLDKYAEEILKAKQTIDGWELIEKGGTIEKLQDRVKAIDAQIEKLNNEKIPLYEEKVAQLEKQKAKYLEVIEKQKPTKENVEEAKPTISRIKEASQEKPIYEMTRREFAEFDKPKIVSKKDMPKATQFGRDGNTATWGDYHFLHIGEGLSDDKWEQKYRGDYHYDKIKEAIEQGKKVPQEVLNDFPDLAGKPPINIVEEMKKRVQKPPFSETKAEEVKPQEAETFKLGDKVMWKGKTYDIGSANNGVYSLIDPTNEYRQPSFTGIYGSNLTAVKPTIKEIAQASPNIIIASIPKNETTEKDKQTSKYSAINTTDPMDFTDPKEEDIKDGSSFKLIRGNIYKYSKKIGTSLNLQDNSINSVLPSAFGDEVMEKRYTHIAQLLKKAKDRVVVINNEIALANSVDANLLTQSERELVYKLRDEQRSLENRMLGYNNLLNNRAKEKRELQRKKDEMDNLGLVWLTNERETAIAYAESMKNISKGLLGEKESPSPNYDIITITPKKILDLSKITNSNGSIKGYEKLIEKAIGLELEDLPIYDKYQDFPTYALFRDDNAKMVVDSLLKQGYDTVRLNENGKGVFILINKPDIIKEEPKATITGSKASFEGNKARASEAINTNVDKLQGVDSQIANLNDNADKLLAKVRLMGERKVKSARSKIKEASQEVQNEIDAIEKEMMEYAKRLNTGVDPKQVELGIRLASSYAKAGMYKLADIVLAMTEKYGMPAVNKLYTSIKQGYSAYKSTAPKEIRSQMDSEDYIYDTQFEDIMNLPTQLEEVENDNRGNNQGGTTPVNDKEQAELIGGKSGNNTEANGGIQSSERNTSNSGEQNRSEEVQGSSEQLGRQRTTSTDGEGIAEPTDDTMVQQPNGETNGNDVVKNGNYDLREKEPISLTKAQRKEINAQVKAILQTNPKSEDLTEEQKNILRQYTGEGGLSAGETIESLYQYYTSYPVIKSIYKALNDMGVKMTKALEPAVGSGNFIGMNPELKWTAIDLDPINAKITELLYPNAKVVNDSFLKYIDNDFDLVVSNVPFAQKTAETKYSLHDSFFTHALDRVKDGGIIAFITSTSTMDKAGAEARQEMMNSADFLGAVRLPSGTFSDTHTQVTTDLIFLQKRPKGVESATKNNNDSFLKVVPFNDSEAKINAYYIKHPENLLGTVGISTDQFNKPVVSVTGTPDISNIADKISKPTKFSVKEQPKEKTILSSEEIIEDAKQKGFEVRRSDNEKYGENIIIEDGKVFVMNNTQNAKDVSYKYKTYEEINDTTANKILALEELRLIAENYQKYDILPNADEIKELLNNYKEEFTTAPSNDKELKKVFKDLDEVAFFNELSSLISAGFTPSPVFTEKTRFENNGKIKISEKSTLEDKAFSELDLHGKIDLENSKLLSPKDMQELVKLGYAIIGESEVQHPIHYYSGDIYKHIDNTQLLKSNTTDANIVKILDGQISRLEELKPAYKHLESINFKGNENWIEPFRQILGIRKKTSNVDVGTGRKQTVTSETVFTYFDRYADADEMKIYNNYMNNSPLVSLTTTGIDDFGRTVSVPLSAQEQKTAITKANKIVAEINAKLKEKIASNPETLHEFELAYNKKFNGYKAPNYTAMISTIQPYLTELSKIKVGGKPFALRSNQVKWILQALYEGKGVNAHDVGGGKTYSAIVLSRILKDRGQANKPLYVVPAKTLKKWERDIKTLYPDAKVLNMGKLTKDKRKEMLAKAMNQPYDYVLVSMEGMQTISLPVEDELRYFEQMAQENLRNSDLKGSQRSNQELKIEAYKKVIRNRETRDTRITMDKLGFDSIVADEAHNFKNVGMSSQLARWGAGKAFSFDSNKGTLESWQSYDFRFKTRWIAERNNNNNIFLLSATPTPNKPMEAYTMLRHLSDNLLGEYGIETDKDFADMFLRFESIPDTNKKAGHDNIISKIVNGFQLRGILNRYFDKIPMSKMPHITVPTANVIQHSFEENPDMQKIMDDVRGRISRASGKRGKGSDTIPGIYQEARSASVDPRLYGATEGGHFNPEVRAFARTHDVKNDKIEAVVSFVSEVNAKNKDAGQLIFLDLAGHTAKESGKLSMNLHEEMKAELIKKGFKASEIGIISGQQITDPRTGKEVSNSAKSDILKQALVDLYNDGETDMFGTDEKPNIFKSKIKVLIGTTASMGEGMDIQKPTTDIYHMDIPYRPSDYIQRNGRGVRFGNRNANVNIHYLFQQGTFDQLSFRTVAKKQGWNEAFWDKEAQDVIDTKADMGSSMPTENEIKLELEKNPIKKHILKSEIELENLIDSVEGYSYAIQELQRTLQSQERQLSFANSNVDDKIKSRDALTETIAKMRKDEVDEAKIKAKVFERDAIAVDIARYRQTIKEMPVKIEKTKFNLSETQKSINDVKDLVNEFTSVYMPRTYNSIKDRQGISLSQIGSELRNGTVFVPQYIKKQLGYDIEKVEVYSLGNEKDTTTYYKNGMISTDDYFGDIFFNNKEEYTEYLEGRKKSKNSNPYRDGTIRELSEKEIAELENDPNKTNDYTFLKKDSSLKQTTTGTEQAIPAEEMQAVIDEASKMVTSAFQVTEKIAEDANAEYDIAENLIKLSPSKANAKTIFHETGHAGLMLLNPKQAKALLLLQRDSKGNRLWDGKGDMWDIENNEGLRKAHEAIADKFADYIDGKKQNEFTENLFTKLKNALVDLYQNITNTISEKGYFRSLESGKLKAKGTKVTTKTGTLFQKQTPAEYYQEIWDKKKALERRNAKLTNEDMFQDAETDFEQEERTHVIANIETDALEDISARFEETFGDMGTDIDNVPIAKTVNKFLALSDELMITPEYKAQKTKSFKPIFDLLDWEIMFRAVEKQEEAIKDEKYFGNFTELRKLVKSGRKQTDAFMGKLQHYFEDIAPEGELTLDEVAMAVGFTEQERLVAEQLENGYKQGLNVVKQGDFERLIDEVLTPKVAGLDKATGDIVTPSDIISLYNLTNKTTAQFYDTLEADSDVRKLLDERVDAVKAEFMDTVNTKEKLFGVKNPLDPSTEIITVREFLSNNASNPAVREWAKFLKSKGITTYGIDELNLAIKSPEFRKVVVNYIAEKYKSVPPESLVYDDKFINDLWKTSDKFKMEMAQKLVEDKYRSFGNKFYLDLSRPLKKTDYVVRGQFVNDKGELEPVFTYFDNKQSARDYIEKHRIQKAELYSVKDIEALDELSNSLSESQFLSLVQQTGKSLEDPAIKKLHERIIARGWRKHTIKRKFVKGLKWTAQELEEIANQNISGAVSYAIKQPAFQKAERMLNKLEDTNKKMAKNALLPESAKAKAQNQILYARKYIAGLKSIEDKTISNIRFIMATWNLGLKPSFYAQNILQPLTQNLALLKKEAGWAKGASSFAKGYLSTYNNDPVFKDMFKRLEYSRKASSQENFAIDDLETSTEDFYNRHNTTHARRVLMASIAPFKFLSKVMLFIGQKLEYLNRLITAKQFYSAGLTKGLSGEDLLHYIAKSIDKTQGDYSKGGRSVIMNPTTYDSKGRRIARGMFNVFRTYSVHNEALNRELWRDDKTAYFLKKGITTTFSGIKYGAYIGTLGVVWNILRSALPDDDDDMVKWSKINKSFDQHLGDLKDKLNKDGMGWLVNGIWDMFGYDAGGQFAESAPIPTEGLRYSKNPLFKGQMGKVTAKDLAGAGLEAIGTGAMSKYAEETTDATLALFSILMNATNKRNDLVEKELEKIGGRLTHKKIARAEEKVTESILKEQKTMLGILPDFAKSWFTGRGWQKEGVRTRAGKLVVPADELTSKDIYSKIFLGVNTTKISEAYRKKFEK